MQEQMSDWLNALINASQNAVFKVISFTPNLVVALLILLLGTIVGRWIGRFVEVVLNKMRFSELGSALHLEKYLAPFGMTSLQQFLGKLAHFLIFMITLIAATDILELPQVTSLVQTVLLYIPKAIVALLILVVGLWASRLSDNILTGELSVRIPPLKGLVRFLIVTFALLAALHQFEISPKLIEILFAGMIFAMSLATGLSFGLGGKDAARELLEKLKKK
jgi:hypothetical protein